MKTLCSFLLLAALIIPGCRPEEGPGGKAKISGTVSHHDAPIPFASVFIHFGGSEPPGNSPSAYQDSTKTDAQGRFEFSGLQKGKYYLYSTGWDASWSPPSTVFGGIPVEIFQRREDVQIKLPVSE